jgi:hypothetical protein
MLKEGKDRVEFVGPYIRAMSWYGASDDEVFEKLSEVYDLDNPEDLMFIAKAAKESGAIGFTRNVIERTRKQLVISG